jgi:iron complex outermembrane receptor protein
MRRGFERRTALTMMAMLAGTALTKGVLAQDGSATRVEDMPALAQSPQPVAFDIPAQPLASALTAFGRQSGYQISVDQATLANLSSSPVSGAMAPEEALRRLLSGTGLAWRPGGGRSVFITKAAGGQGALQLDPVQVQGFAVPSQAMIDNIPPPYAGGQVATGGQLGLLGNRGVMDTPFNQTSYTAKKAQDQQATTLRDVLLDDPSVRGSSPSSILQDTVRIRGFSSAAAGAISYGGLFGILPRTSTMAELAERVEVLKGPSALLNGMANQGNIGGTVNVVPKRAPDEGITQITADYISAAQFGGHVDIARRFGDEKEVGVRFNGVYKGGQSEINMLNDQKALGVLGVDYRGDRFRFSADLGYQQFYIAGYPSFVGLAANVPLPSAPNARTNLGQAWSDLDRRDYFGVVRAELDVTERVTAYVSLGAHLYRSTGLYYAGVTVNNVNGNATSTVPFNLDQYTTYRTAEAGLRASLETGPIGHELAFTGNSYGMEDGTSTPAGAAIATNLYNPVSVARPNLPFVAASKTSTQNFSSIGIADTLSAADKRVQLTVGARLQQVQAANFNAISGAQTSNYNQSALSPAVALVFKPWHNVSIYGNYIQGLQQGTIVGAGFANAGEIFPPFKSTQYEVGLKVDWGKLTTTASIFQINQPSILTNVATNTQFLGGEQVNQGLELNIFGEVTEGFRVLGGAMFLNAVLTKTAGGLTNGWIAPFSPGAQFNIGGEWDLPFAKGLTLNGRVTYTGAQFIDTLSPRRSLPEWVRLDVGARYAFENPGAKGKLLVARFNVENLLDSNFWEGGFGSTTLFLGAPRTFRFALTADF